MRSNKTNWMVVVDECSILRPHIERTKGGSFMRHPTVVAATCLLVLAVPASFGQFWGSQTSPVAESLSGVSFGSATAGLAVGANGSILRTSDGGIVWTKVTGISGLDPSLCCSRARFFNSSIVWLVGSATLLRSQSAGSSWFGFSYSSYIRRSIIPVTGDTAWVVGNSNSGGRAFIRYSIVGNNTTTNLWSHADADTLYDVDFVDPDNGWAVGAPGRIVRITSGSAATPQFANQATGTSVALRGIDMVDANNGWVVGDQGTILHTTNGGSSWTPQTSGTVNSLRGVSFKNLTEGYAVGTGGLILGTADGGVTWTSESSGVSNDLLSVFHGSATVAVGTGGTIVRHSTSPGGCDHSLTSTGSGLWSSSGGTGSFTVNTQTGCTWSAVPDVGWLTITAGASGSGTGTVSFSIAPNTATAAREGHIAVGGSTFAATQYGTAGVCPFTLTQPATFTALGGAGSVSVSTLAGCFWGLFSDVGWITIDAPTTGFGSGAATYRVASNSSGASRTGTISIGGSSAARVTITETATAPARHRAVRH